MPTGSTRRQHERAALRAEVRRLVGAAVFFLLALGLVGALFGVGLYH